MSDKISTEGLKITTLYFDIGMFCECPHCKFDINLEDYDLDDDGVYLDAFRDWVNNKKGANKVSFVELCPNCEREFKMEEVVR